MVKCLETGCFRRAQCGFSNGPVLYCTAHVRDGMTGAEKREPKTASAAPKKCMIKGCDSSAVYGIRKMGGLRYTHCKLHAVPGMKHHNPCRHPGCMSSASFRARGMVATSCKIHADPDMMRSTVCIADGCNEIATRRGVFGKSCDEHDNDPESVIITKMCIADGCDKRATFGDCRQNVQFCRHHRTEGMVNAHVTLCKFEGCKISARYSRCGRRYDFCKTHMEDGMLLHFRHRCRAEGCNISGKFYEASRKREVYCATHKTESMKTRLMHM